MINPDEVLERADELAKNLQRAQGRPILTGVCSTQIDALCRALVEAINDQLGDEHELS